MRVIDANLNRLREGLRVIEDTVRFVYNDGDKTLVLKKFRHTLGEFARELPGGQAALLRARDSAGDIGAMLNTQSEMTRLACGEILTANFKRAQESARVLEEYAKMFSSAHAAEIKKIRFALYQLERECNPVPGGAAGKEGFSMAELKVLFHVNEPERWPRALVNIGNFIKDVGQGNAEIEVVANGAAVTSYVAGDKLNQEMAGMADLGVKFVACRNALRMHSLEENTLPSFVAVVPAGITEIAKKQAEGYAYIKP